MFCLPFLRNDSLPLKASVTRFFLIFKIRQLEARDLFRMRPNDYKIEIMPFVRTKPIETLISSKSSFDH